MSRPKLTSSLKMEDVRALEAAIISDEKALRRQLQNKMRFRKWLFKLSNNQNAKFYGVAPVPKPVKQPKSYRGRRPEPEASQSRIAS